MSHDRKCTALPKILVVFSPASFVHEQELPNWLDMRIEFFSAGFQRHNNATLFMILIQS